MGIFSVVGGVTGISRICGRMISSGGGGVVSPWLMLRPWYESDDIEYRFYNVEDKQVVRLMEVLGEEEEKRASKFVGSSHGFLVGFDKDKRGGLYLTDLVRRRRLELPPLSTAPDSDDHVSRVLLSCSPESDDQECRALMIHGEKQQLLASCVPQHSDKWSSATPVVERRKCLSSKYDNISYSNTRRTFFCIVQVEYEDVVGATIELESWDLSAPRIPSILNLDSQLLKKKKHEACSQFRYLVVEEPTDQLFLVVRHALHQCPRDANPEFDYPYKTVDFDVYKIDADQKLVSHCSSLDGLALFVGVNHPIALRPGPASRLQPNSIYFADLPHDNPYFPYIHCGDNGVFNYESKAFSSFHHHHRQSEVGAVNIQSIAMRSLLSWPFPLWYSPTQCA